MPQRPNEHPCNLANRRELTVSKPNRRNLNNYRNCNTKKDFEKRVTDGYLEVDAEHLGYKYKDAEKLKKTINKEPLLK